MLPVSNRHILVVASGAGGGIGRFERLLVQALSVLGQEEQFTLDAVYAQRPPDYLLTGPGAAPVQALSALPEGSSNAAFVGSIARRLRRRSPDLTIFTHVNHMRALIALAPLGAHPYAVCGYGIEIWDRRGWPVRTALSRARRVLAISSYTKRRLAAAQAVPNDRIAVVPLAIERGWRDGAEAARAPAVQRAATEFLTVSRLDPRESYKGVEAAIRAVAACRSAGLDVHHHIVGEGGDLTRLRTVAAECDASGAVSFHGRVGDGELRAYYANSDAFVLPSRGEGFGLVFLEAMAAGLPVVAARACATPEVVTHGRTGLLVKSDDELGDALLAVARGQVDTASMGAAAREEVAGRFSFQRFVGRVAAFLEQCIPDRKGG